MIFRNSIRNFYGFFHKLIMEISRNFYEIIIMIFRNFYGIFHKMIVAQHMTQ